MRADFIEKRIDHLLEDKNFFFFKIFKDTEKDFVQKNEIEMQEIKRLIDMHKTTGKCYLKSG